MTPIYLRKVIKSSGLSKGEFAAKLKVHQVSLSRWINGKVNITRQMASLIRETFRDTITEMRHE